MTAEEFEAIAVGLFENRSKNKDKFNPIIDAAKELAANKISIYNVDPNVLIYSLLLLRKHVNNVTLQIYKHKKKIIDTSNFNEDVTREQITKQVEEIFKKDPRQNQTFDKMVNTMIRKERAKTRKVIGEEFETNYSVYAEIQNGLYLNSNSRLRAAESLSTVALNLRNYYYVYIDGVLDQYL